VVGGGWAHQGEHEDSLLERATDLPSPSADEDFYDAWKVYGHIAVSSLFIIDEFNLSPVCRHDTLWVWVWPWRQATWPMSMWPPWHDGSKVCGDNWKAWLEGEVIQRYEAIREAEEAEEKANKAREAAEGLGFRV
jgi:hypothetical protein